MLNLFIKTMKDNILKNKQFLGIIFAIIAFAAITLIYFSPILEGKRIKQHDIEMYKGMSHEINQFREETGEQSLWTNSMFGGMPAWNIGVQQNSNLMTYVQKIIGLGFPSPIMSVFISMLGFFILLLVLDCKIWISFIGALAYGFTSYLFIVMGAGHNSKAVAMAYMAPVIAGIIMTYKGKYLWGAVLTAIALALEIRAGHIQITYYLFMIVLIFIIAEFIDAIRNKQFPEFFKASSLHSGIAEFDPMVSLDEYMPEDFVSTALAPDEEYYEGTTVVVGCTPTSELGSASKIFRAQNGNIFINCGETLGCLCLESGEEFYV